MLALLSVAAVFLGTLGAYVWLNWKVNQTMYAAKAGIDWFKTVFYGNLTFGVSALLALLLLNPVPWRSDLFEAVSSVVAATSGVLRPVALRPSRALWAFWQFAKWTLAFAAFVTFNGIPGMGNLVIAVAMMLRGYGDWSLVPRIFLSPVQPMEEGEIIAAIPAMEVQYKVVHDVLILLLAVLAARLFLRFVRDLSRGRVGPSLKGLFLCLSCVVLSIIVGVGYWEMDATTPFAFLALSTILFSFIAASFVAKAAVPEGGSFSKGRRGAAILVGAVLLSILLANMGVIGWYRLNWNNNWTQYEWQPLTRKQIAVTRWAAGIRDVQAYPLDAIPPGNTSMILSLVRQWDRDAAFTRMKNQIGVNWMTLSDAYVVYVNGREYWVAPTTILYPSDDWISHHLIYTHASRVIVMDSHTGDYVPVTEAFGVPKEPLIYYGEGFYDNVYVRVRGFSEIENVSYAGEPDYVLSGWERMLWFASSGQFGFAFSPPQDRIEMLYKRDIFERVEGMLIHGLDVDPAAYLVTDGERLYAAVQVFVDYDLQSGFAASSYLRFLGVVLVDIEDGRMHGYLVAKTGPEDFLLDFYANYYGWEQPPEWLVPQLRYPERLLGTQEEPRGQLDVDFRYHVDDAFVWRSGSDFYERPGATEVLYILHTVGDKAYFVGLQLVEYEASPGKNLAGLYLVYGGARIGEIQFYRSTPRANATQLIGPSAALEALETDDYVRAQLTLLTNSRLGNILLYSIGGKLYYFIPVYITTATAGGVITKMAFIGVVDAATGSKVATGQDALSAYRSLSGAAPTTGWEERLRKVLDIFSSEGIEAVKIERVLANVEIEVGEARYVAEGDWESARIAVKGFVEDYAKRLGAEEVYYWSVDENTVGFGALASDRGVVKLYYVTLKLK
ncbi:MAG: UPF0182 family protein [Candidatus Brockarchaeota archaeon]|nr:UPF0182 family protein [Candidatus Brockarchaeota archaeon]